MFKAMETHMTENSWCRSAIKKVSCLSNMAFQKAKEASGQNRLFNMLIETSEKNRLFNMIIETSEQNRFFNMVTSALECSSDSHLR